MWYAIGGFGALLYLVLIVTLGVATIRNGHWVMFHRDPANSPFGLARLRRALRVDEHDIEHIVGRVKPRNEDVKPHADDEGRVQRDGRDERDLHRGHEAETLEEEVRKRDERVG